MKALAATLLAGMALGQAPRPFEPEGVCSIDEKAVLCWGFDGSPLPTLTAEIDRKVRALPYGLDFAPGKKNRWVVVRTGEYASLSFAGGVRIRDYVLTADGGPARTLFRVAALPQERMGSLTLNVGVYEGAPVEMPFRKGAQAVIDGVRVELGPIGRNPNYRNPLDGSFVLRNRFPGPGGPWRVAIDQTGAGPGGRIAFEPLDHDGKPIHFLDADGKPVSDAKVEASKPDPSKPIDLSRVFRYDYASFGFGFGYGSPEISLWTTTNIDPKWIAKLRLKHIVNRTEVVGPFPLDPNPVR